MLENFDFEFDRLATIEAIMNDIATFRPDGQTPGQVATMKSVALSVRTAYVDVTQSLSLLRGGVDAAWAQVHDANVQVHGSFRSLYRKDPASLRAIEALPVQDQSRAEIEKRAEAIAALWPKLPLPPPPYPVPGGPPPHIVEPFSGMTVLVFTGLLESARSLENTLPDLEAEYEKQEGLLHEQEAKMRDFNVAARAQGLVQFPTGWQHEVIEAIPTNPPELPPSKGEIVDVEAPGGTTILVRVTAAHASKFTLEGMAPGAGSFAVLVPTWPTVRIPCTLPVVGDWTLRARGENAKGTGDWSDDYEVTVPA
jgi:hypothetical protein